ncbi:hypothetical protein ONS95_013739 [Cadophora gregata]|uniref:uncharacterized protein n=1 Tax=Cadophora gregata TaxID=51156 RepID=UPI0026DACF23|nr:uncharacterized protein ONS95_013739 [Cadophora gregata]KAK0114240.1 hypothetical protein ONS95_013739 [Cadophora gregata]
MLSFVLDLSTLGLCSPPHSLTSPVIRHEGHEEDPQSDLHSVIVSKTTLETIRHSVSSGCFFTMTFEGNLMTHSKPCSVRSIHISRTAISKVQAAVTARPTGMCTKTFIQDGTAYFRAVTSLHTDGMFGTSAVNSEMPIAPTSCGTQERTLQITTITFTLGASPTKISSLE